MAYQLINVSSYQIVCSSDLRWKNPPSMNVFDDIKTALQWDTEDDIVCASFEEDRVFQLINNNWVEEIHEFSESEDGSENGSENGKEKKVTSKLLDDISRNNYTVILHSQ